MKEPVPEKRPCRPRLLRRSVLMVTALFLLAVGWLAWKGPSAALRFAVRIYDPALRLEVGSSFFRDGEWVLQGVVLSLRGSR